VRVEIIVETAGCHGVHGEPRLPRKAARYSVRLRKAALNGP
jgi:hypothetical protein